MDQTNESASENDTPNGVEMPRGAESSIEGESTPEIGEIRRNEEAQRTAPPSLVDLPLETGLLSETGPSGSLGDKWLEAFYKECGREVTLAYTTLNQMKNFAMIAVAAAISGIAFSKDAERFPDERMFVGVVIVYVFVLRFFFRAVICYINLTRWNNLQNACMQLMLLPDSRPERARNQTERGDSFRYRYQSFYLEWLSPISRSAQVASNLKLGFGLLFALPIFFGVWGVISLWQSPIVEGMTTFALGITFVEVYDFFASEIFDNVIAHQRRKPRRGDAEYYPTPAARWLFALQWLAVALISLSVTVIRQHVASRPIVSSPPSQASSGLLIKSDPSGAIAYIDGIQRGVTPLSIAVAPGNRIIEVRQKGFVPSDVSIDVSPGHIQSVSLQLHDLPKPTQRRAGMRGKN